MLLLNRLHTAIFAVLGLSQFYGLVVLWGLGAVGRPRKAIPYRHNASTRECTATARSLWRPAPCRSRAPAAFMVSCDQLHSLTKGFSRADAGRSPAQCTIFVCSFGGLPVTRRRLPTASRCSCNSTIAGRRNGTCAWSLPAAPHVQVTSTNSLICGLPRGVRASTLIMPGCAHQPEWERGTSIAIQNGQSVVEEPATEYLGTRITPDHEAVSSQAKPGGNLLGFPFALRGNPLNAEHRQELDDKSAAAAAAGKLLHRARLLQSTASGLFCMLPLGFRVMKKIEAICHEEMGAVGAAPLSLPNLMPIEWLHNSNRVRAFGPSLYRLHDRRERELFLPPTCEEASALLVSLAVRSHRDLPLLFYQFGPKFRDEARPRAGCLRAREFYMLEAYSFHQDVACRETAYHMMHECFQRVFARVGASPVHRFLAGPGTMGGSCSHEYHVCSLLGEEHSEPQLTPAQPVNSTTCVGSGAIADESVPPGRSLELGHCFQLPGTYCQAAGARFTDSCGMARVPLMNSYGLGISRLLAHLALSHQDAKGLSFPSQVAPFTVAVLPQPAARWNGTQRAARMGQAFFNWLQRAAADAGGPADVLLDDRRGLTLRQMQAHANLVGIPYQVIIKEKLLQTPGAAHVIYTARSSGKADVLPLRAALSTLKGLLVQTSIASQTSSVDAMR